MGKEKIGIKATLVILFVFLALPSCTGLSGLGSDTAIEQALDEFHASIPIGYYVAVIGGKPSSIVESELFNKLKVLASSELGGVETGELPAWEALLKKINFFEVLVTKDVNTVISFVKGDLDLDDIAEFARRLGGRGEEILETSYRNNEYSWLGGVNGMCVLRHGGGLVFAREDKIKQIIDFKSDGGKSLAETKDMESFKDLVDDNADVFFAYWGGIPVDQMNPMQLAMSASLYGIEQDDIYKLVQALNDIKVITMSGHVDGNIMETIRIRFGTNESALKLKAFLDSYLSTYFSLMANAIEQSATNDVIEKMSDFGLTPYRIRNYADEIEIDVRDDVMEVKEDLGVVSLASVAVPSFLNALDRARQATTVANVVQMGQGVDRYIQDHPRIGAPRVDSIEELQRIFEETEINLNPSMTKDGWGFYLHYSYDASGLGRLFTVQSYGADGAPGPEVVPNAFGELIVRHFDEDIIYSSGRLVQHPEGAQTRRH